MITPQTIRAPEFPAGSVFSSSGSRWMISEAPPGWRSEARPAVKVTPAAVTSMEPVPSGPTVRFGRSPA